MREQMSLKVRRQTSSLVFIFLFCIRLKVQRVSCSTVKYLYIHMYLSQFILFGIHTFSCLSCSSFLWMQLPCFGTQLIAILFVHSFNIVLRILFEKKKKKELLLLVPLYTYLYLNKTISDKEHGSCESSELISLVSCFIGHGEQWKTKPPM